MSAPAQDDFCGTMLSRSGASSTSGKLSCRLDIPVSEELQEAVITMAALAGVPKSEYVRQLIERQLFGEFSMAQRMHQASRPGQWESGPRNIG